MTTKTDICNMALANIRAQSVTDLDSNDTVEQKFCNLKYDYALDFVLREAPWNFAKKQLALAEIEDEDLFEWVYCYSYPSDCIRINKLLSEINRMNVSSNGNAIRPDYYDTNPLNDYSSRLIQIPYDVLMVSGVKVIGANESNLWIEYLYRNETPNDYDSAFVIALSWYLAAELAMPILGGDSGRKEREMALSMYQKTLAAAISANSNEQYFGTPRESDLILGRG